MNWNVFHRSWRRCRPPFLICRVPCASRPVPCAVWYSLLHQDSSSYFRYRENSLSPLMQTLCANDRAAQVLCPARGSQISDVLPFVAQFNCLELEFSVKCSSCFYHLYASVKYNQYDLTYCPLRCSKTKCFEFLKKIRQLSCWLYNKP